MKRLGEDTKLRRKMGHAARQIIIGSFNWDIHVKEWNQLYELYSLQKV